MEKGTPLELSKTSDFSAMNADRADQVFGIRPICANNLYFTTALAEEVGELCGAVKKLQRGFNERELWKTREKYKKSLPKDNQDFPEPSVSDYHKAWATKLTKEMAKEAADIFIYLDLFCTANNINLKDAVIEKFNEVSVGMNCIDQFELKP